MKRRTISTKFHPVSRAAKERVFSTFRVFVLLISEVIAFLFSRFRRQRLGCYPAK